MSARLELVSLEWVRIQLVVRLRVSDESGAAGSAAGPDQPAVWLERVAAEAVGAEDGAATRMRPTRLIRDGRDLVARFNVMQGPRQAPLAAGTWRLAGSVPVTDPEGRATELAPAIFPTPAGTYAIRTVAGLGGAPELEISLDPGKVAPGARPRTGLHRAGRLVRRIGRSLFRRAVRFSSAVTAGRRPAILFTSSTRPQLGGNLAVVHDRMVERGLLRDVDVLFSFRPDLHGPWPLRERLRLPWLFGRARVVVLDDYHPSATLLDYQRSWIVQLWHASGVVKTILYSRIGKPDGPDPWARHYKNYRYAIVGAEGDVPHFAEAFGLPEERVIPTGIPRMDRFFDEQARAAGRDAALAAHPEARGRFVILFAPTFRGVGAGRSFDMGVLDYEALHALCVEKDAVFVIRLHPRLRNELRIPERLRDRLLDGSDVATDAPDILFATDLLITDYSSIIFEFATLDRPMLFYAPDLETYREEVDFYEPYEDLVPGRIVHTMPELVDAIRRDDYGADRVPAFVERHLSHLDGRATDRVIDQLILPGLRRRPRP